jgi:glc operon protein GlcG
VWLTGVKTGEYEKLVYSGRAVPEQLGLAKPDLIGWEGGQPIVLDHEITISVGFSGFRGESDLDIVMKAVEDIR